MRLDCFSPHLDSILDVICVVHMPVFLSFGSLGHLHQDHLKCSEPWRIQGPVPIYRTSTPGNANAYEILRITDTYFKYKN